MPDQLKTARMTGSSLVSDVPARIGELEAALSTITGIPLDVLIAAPMSEVVAIGLRRIFFQDLSIPPANGELSRNGTILQFGNGGAASKDIPLSEFDAGENTVTNSAIEAPLYTRLIEGGLLHTSGVIEGSVAVFVNSILNGSNLHILLYYAGAQIISFPIINVSGGTLTSFGAFIRFRIQNRNSPSVQLFYGAGEIPLLSNNLHVGTPGQVRDCNIIGTTVNSAVDQFFQVNALWSLASISNSCVGIGLSLLRLR